MDAELTQKLVADYKVLVTDAEELIKATASQSTEKIAEARARMQQALLDLKPRLANAEAVLKDARRRHPLPMNTFTITRGSHRAAAGSAW